MGAIEIMKEGSKPDWQELNPESYKLLTGAGKLLALDPAGRAKVIPNTLIHRIGAQPCGKFCFMHIFVFFIGVIKN